MYRGRALALALGCVFLLGSSVAGPSAVAPGTGPVQYRTENSRTLAGADGHYVTQVYPGSLELGRREGPGAGLDIETFIINPEQAEYWTGRVRRYSGNSYEKQSGVLRVQGRSSSSQEAYKSWLRFDLTELGDTVTIDSVWLGYYTYEVSTTGPPSVVTSLTLDPLTAGAQELYAAIGAGWPLTPADGEAMGWHCRYLGDLGSQFIAGRLDTGWVALGLHTTITNNDQWANIYGYTGGPPPFYYPYLMIKWSPPPHVDIGVLSIIQPVGTYDWAATVSPTGYWVNYGTAAATFNAYFSLFEPNQNRIYFESTAVTLDVDQDTVLSFPSYFFNYNNGLWSAVCSTAAPADINDDNDMQSNYFWVTQGGFNPDMAATEIISPLGYFDTSATVTPMGRFHNNSPFPVSYLGIFTILDPNGVLRHAAWVDVDDLGPGLDTVVTFDDFTVDTTRGTWVSRCSSATIGDTIPGNDVIAGGFGVYPGGYPSDPPDIGITAILAPVGYVDTCVTVTPRAVWHNYSTVYSANFSAWFSITDPNDVEVYSDVVPVSGLGIGMDTNVVFDDFTIDTTRGIWAIRCSTYALSDTNPANDVLISNFGVYPGGEPPWDPGWKEVKPMPAPPSNLAIKDGGWLALNPFDDYIYAAKGNKTNDFFRYDARADTWSTLTGMPYTTHPVWYKKPPRKGSVGVSDGSAYLYVTQGNNSLGFWRYHVPGDSWEMLPDVPFGPGRKKVKGGTDMAYIVRDDTGYVYLLKGYKTEFYRYNTASEQWEDRTTAPTGQRAKWDKGSWLCREDEDAAVIYAHKAKYHELYAYDVDGDSWGPNLGGMPFIGRMARRKKSKDGGSAAWHAGTIYALKGGNTQEFWKYTPASGDTWTELESIPAFGSTGKKKRVKTGGDLVYYGDEAFFAIKGNKTLELWRYVMAPWPARPEPAVRGGVAGSSFDIRRSSLVISPNPLSTGFARVRYDRFLGGAATLRVYDAAGRAVLTRSLILGPRGTIDLDLRTLSAGTYFVRLSDRGGNSTSKLVINQ